MVDVRYLYLLSNGIFFGFKKPLVYLEHTAILDICVTSKTSKTFNMTVYSALDASHKGHEFCMIEINDYDAIMEYVSKMKSRFAKPAETATEAADIPVMMGPIDMKTAQFLSDEEDEDFDEESSASDEELEFTEDEQGEGAISVRRKRIFDDQGSSDSENDTTSPEMTSEEVDELADDE
jgi:hypothetical protein